MIAVIQKLLDYLPFFKVRKLTENEKEEVEKNGLFHLTSAKAATKILEEKKLKGRWRVTNYSNGFKRSVFLFSCDLTEREKWFNYSVDFEICIKLLRIPPEQVIIS